MSFSLDLFPSFRCGRKLAFAHRIRKRDRAFEVYPYPRIGHSHFLNFNLNHHPLYPQLLERLCQGQKLLDLGCCFAQDTRKLLFDGAPAGNVYGTDLQKQFIYFSYDLFLDRDRLQANFFIGDILNPKADS